MAKLDEEELRKRIRRLWKELRSHDPKKQYLTQTDLRKHGKEYGISSFYLRIFYKNRLADMLADCGVPASPLAKAMAVSDDQLLSDLLELGKGSARPPTSGDILREGKFTVKMYDRFGGAEKGVDDGTVKNPNKPYSCFSQTYLCRNTEERRE